MAWCEALRVANVRALARAERRWDDLPPPMPRRRSIWLITRMPAIWMYSGAHRSSSGWDRRRPGGHARLAAWLLAAADPEEIRARQRGVTELAALDEWRERLAAHGMRAAGARQIGDRRLPGMGGGAAGVRRLLAPGRPGPDRLDLDPRRSPRGGCRAGRVLAHALVVGILLWFSMRACDRPVVRAGRRRRGGAGALRGAVRACRGAPSTASGCAPRRNARGRGAPAHVCMRRFNSILGYAKLRHGAAMLHFPIQALTLWDVHVVFALERWRRQAGSHVRDWLSSLGTSTRSPPLPARHDNPTWVVPQSARGRSDAAEAIGHPLIEKMRRVPNDVSLARQERCCW